MKVDLHIFNAYDLYIFFVQSSYDVLEQIWKIEVNFAVYNFFLQWVLNSAEYEPWRSPHTPYGSHHSSRQQAPLHTRSASSVTSPKLERRGHARSGSTAGVVTATDSYDVRGPGLPPPVSHHVRSGSSSMMTYGTSPPVLSPHRSPSSYNSSYSMPHGYDPANPIPTTRSPQHAVVEC